MFGMSMSKSKIETQTSVALFFGHGWMKFLFPLYQIYLTSDKTFTLDVK